MVAARISACIAAALFFDEVSDASLIVVCVPETAISKSSLVFVSNENDSSFPIIPSIPLVIVSVLPVPNVNTLAAATAP
ncbi:MAG: hypothetical protein BWY06_03469 [Candidatus Latescibacteria bacterium ADurb.Bin168]|nr:MAG: hypothetical protein BWY06_03469 [Candidatus Latescibacteria bacterium ADurb.Bin168]